MMIIIKKYFGKFLNLIDYLAQTWWGRLILLAIPLFISYFTRLFGIQANAHLDNLNIYFPIYSFYQYAFKNNLSVLINPFTLNGSASYAGAFVGFLSPINYLLFGILNLPLFLADSWLIFIYILLGSFFTAQLLRELKCSPVACLIAGYSFSFIFSNLDIAVSASYFWLSLTCWIIIFIYNHDSWPMTFLGSLLIGLGWLTGHPNFMIIAVSGAVIYTLFLIYKIITDTKNYRLINKFFVLFFISSLIGLVQIIPSLISVSISSRGGSYFQETLNFGVFRVGHLAQLFLPLFPLFIGGPYYNYIGMLPLIFATATLFLPKSREIIFWQIFALLAYLITMPFSPLFKLMGYLPILNQLRNPDRWILLGMFGLAVLSGFGFDSWLNNNHANIKKKLYLIFKWLIIFLIIIIITLNITHFLFSQKILNLAYSYFDLCIYSPAKKLSLAHYHQVIDQRYFAIIDLFLLNNRKIVLQLLIIIISIIGLDSFLKSNNKKYSSAFLILIMIFNSVIIHYLYFIHMPNMPSDYLNYKPKTAEFIKIKPGKVFPFLQGQSEYEKLNSPYNPNTANHFIFQAELMAPMINILYQIPGADGDDTIMPERNARLLALIGSTRVDSAKATKENLIFLDTLDKKIKTFYQRQNLIDLLGINYVISVYPLIEDKDFARVHVATTTPYLIPFYIYENKNPLLSVFLAEKVNYLEPNNLEKNLGLINQPENNFNQQTFIECSDCPQNFSINGKIEIIKKSNTKIEIAYEGDNNAWLIICQDFLPGWEAKIDNQNTDIYYADYVYQAIFVPKGNHQIITEYKYPIKYFLNHFLNFNLK